MNKNKTFLIIMTLLLVLGSGVFTEKRVQAKGLDMLKKRLSGVQSFQGKFEQVYFDRLLERTQKSSGEVKYMKPGLMIWDYMAPEELKIVIGKKKIWIFDPLLENVTVQNIDAVTRVEVLSFFFQKEQLKNHFKQIIPAQKYFPETPQTQTVYLAPVKANSNFKEIHLQVEPKRHAITRFAIVEPNNNYRVVSLSHLVFNQIQDERLFEFKIPEGVEVIDGMNP